MSDLMWCPKCESDQYVKNGFLRVNNATNASDAAASLPKPINMGLHAQRSCLLYFYISVAYRLIGRRR